jgi:hypothetical protein
VHKPSLLRIAGLRSARVAKRATKMQLRFVRFPDRMTHESFAAAWRRAAGRWGRSGGVVFDSFDVQNRFDAVDDAGTGFEI